MLLCKNLLGSRSPPWEERGLGQRLSMKHLLFSCVLVFALGAAGPAAAAELAGQAPASNDLAVLHAQILADPNNTALNLQYAKIAEAQGKLRLALVAYERVLANEPENREAQQGLTRVRRDLVPARTRLRTEIGAGYDSNPLNSTKVRRDKPLVFFNAQVDDDRPLGPVRWRSSAAVAAEYTHDIDELSLALASFQTGPQFSATSQITLQPTLGGAVTALDHDYYYSEANAGAILAATLESVSASLRVRGGLRDYAGNADAGDGHYYEAIGTLVLPSLVMAKDFVLLRPWVRVNSFPGTVVTFLNEELQPGKFTEVGGEIGYSWEVFDDVRLGPSFIGRQRYYDQQATPSDDREDTLLAPGISATVLNVFECNCDVKIDYRYRHNSSNDDDVEYAGSRLLGSFISRF